MDKIDTWVGKAYLLLVFLIPVIPQSNTMDVVGLQWFVFSVINLLTIAIILPRITFSKKPTIIITLWGVFIFFAILSTTYSINFSLGLQDVSRWCQILIGIVLFNYFLKKKRLSFMYITNVVIGILFIETVYILIPLFISLYVNGFETEVVLNPGLFNGLTGNKNIAAASVMAKLPFVLYKLKNLNAKNSFIAVVLIVLSILSVLFIAARASYISLLLTTTALIIGGLLYTKGSNKNMIYT